MPIALADADQLKACDRRRRNRRDARAPRHLPRSDVGLREELEPADDAGHEREEDDGGDHRDRH